MADLETIYNDKTAWVSYEGECEETIHIYRRCYCGWYLKIGKLLINGIGQLKFEGWNCKRCGEVTPFFERD